MKKIPYFVSMLLLIGIIVVACKKDDDSTPPGAEHTVSGFTPTSGSVATIVTVKGTNFTNQNIQVKFGTSLATVSGVHVNGTELYTSVPEGAETGKISVTIDGVEVKSAANFTVTNEVTGPESIELAETSLEMHTFDTRLVPEITNIADFSSSTISWESKNTDVLEVDENGNLTALEAGEAILELTIASDDGEFTTEVTVTVEAIVLIVGSEHLENEETKAALWVNGNVSYLSDSFSEAYDVVAGKDGTKYVAGYEEINGKNVATVWIDGEAFSLSDLDVGTYASSLAIRETENGTKIYVSGHKYDGHSSAMFWELGQTETPLTDGQNQSVARSVAIDPEGKIVVVGYESINFVPTSKYWEIEGGSIDLSNSEVQAYANSIAVDNNGNILVAGEDNSIGNYSAATIWEVDGPTSYLTEGNSTARINSIDVDIENEINYSVGTEDLGMYSVAKLWKTSNGETASIDLTHGPLDGQAYSVMNLNGFVHVVGIDTTLDGEEEIEEVFYWKLNENNEILETINLTNTNSEYSDAYSVFVK